MRVVIVANGPSAAGFVPPDGVTVISVNGAIDWLLRADYFFTLDPSAENLRRLNCQRIGVRYHYAYTERLPLRARAEYWERIPGTPFCDPVPGTPQWWANRWGCKLGLSNRVGQIHTGNSAWGALGLAFHLGASRVALVGVDASADVRVTGGIPGNLSHLPLLFESAMGQIELINCGRMVSKLPKMTISDGMNWLCR